LGVSRSAAISVSISLSAAHEQAQITQNVDVIVRVGVAGAPGEQNALGMQEQVPAIVMPRPRRWHGTCDRWK